MMSCFSLAEIYARKFKTDSSQSWGNIELNNTSNVSACANFVITGWRVFRLSAPAVSQKLQTTTQAS